MNEILGTVLIDSPDGLVEAHWRAETGWECKDKLIAETLKQFCLPEPWGTPACIAVEKAVNEFRGTKVLLQPKTREVKGR
jgi:hypothetical protein